MGVTSRDIFLILEKLDNLNSFQICIYTWPKTKNPNKKVFWEKALSGSYTLVNQNAYLYNLWRNCLNVHIFHMTVHRRLRVDSIFSSCYQGFWWLQATVLCGWGLWSWDGMGYGCPRHPHQYHWKKLHANTDWWIHIHKAARQVFFDFQYKIALFWHKLFASVGSSSLCSTQYAVVVVSAS